ncbi:MAG: GNAT family N-acetyltransferase [Trebonia sp.]
MDIDGDTTAAALAQTWEVLGHADPADSWMVRDGGAIGLVTGTKLAALNGVWSERVNPDPDVVAGLLDRVAATGLPYCLQLRPGAGAALAQLAAARGMRAGHASPLMALTDPARLIPAQQVAGLKIRQLDPEEAELHVAVAAAGFELPEEPLRQLVSPRLLSLPGVRCYLGEADGHPVTTGIGVTLGPFVGIFNIATPPADRGHGYGGAVTARVVSDGLAAGASWSWLQSSSAGFGVYERLGFRTVESWRVWLN